MTNTLTHTYEKNTHFQENLLSFILGSCLLSHRTGPANKGHRLPSLPVHYCGSNPELINPRQTTAGEATMRFAAGLGSLRGARRGTWSTDIGEGQRRGIVHLSPTLW